MFIVTEYAALIQLIFHMEYPLDNRCNNLNMTLNLRPHDQNGRQAHIPVLQNPFKIFFSETDMPN